MRGSSLLFAALALSLLAALPATAQESFPASELRLESLFGERDADPTAVYSLLGTGFFLAPRSGQEDALAAAWLAEHPGAVATPVGAMGPMMEDGTGQIVYVWITADDDVLNLYLVRRGAVSGSTMQDGQAFDQRMEAIGMPLDDSSWTERFVSDAAYDTFIDRVVVAEEKARAERLGIWASPGE